MNRNKFLKTLQMIESSGGKNFNHPEIEAGIHEGHRAAGRYGLMPNTTNEVVDRMTRDGRLPASMSDFKELNLEPDLIKARLETNPDEEQAIAEYLADHVLKRQDGDEEKAAYSWHMGHNLTPDAIEKRPYQDSDYVKKYNQFSKIKNIVDNK